MVVKDAEGKIMARAVIRLLWDETSQSPVLFQERLYTRINDSALDGLIREACKRKAEELGVPLVASSKDYPDVIKTHPRYPHALQALGGPAPYEYVDALSGIQKDGKFSINESYIL